MQTFQKAVLNLPLDCVNVSVASQLHKHPDGASARSHYDKKPERDDYGKMKVSFIIKSASPQ